MQGLGAIPFTRERKNPNGLTLRHDIFQSRAFGKQLPSRFYREWQYEINFDKILSYIVVCWFSLARLFLLLVYEKKSRR